MMVRDNTRALRFPQEELTSKIGVAEGCYRRSGPDYYFSSGKMRWENAGKDLLFDSQGEDWIFVYD
jgi:hypothetical protein